MLTTRKLLVLEIMEPSIRIFKSNFLNSGLPIKVPEMHLLQELLLERSIPCENYLLQLFSEVLIKFDFHLKLIDMGLLYVRGHDFPVKGLNLLD